jgi:hypothetical protein
VQPGIFYIRSSAITSAVMVLTLLCNPSPARSQEPKNTAENKNGCDYYMCGYEKSNIDTIIIEHAKTCQTVMFGEIHDNVVQGMPAPVADSSYVITLLSKLREIGYEYLALEVDKTASQGHSYDVVRFYKNYKKGNNSHKDKYPAAKPGWIELVKNAVDLDYKIRFIDIATNGSLSNIPRDESMFNRIKEEIFDKNKNAKVIVYIGAFHIGECETNMGIYMCKGKRRPLGYFLDHYTRGKNFSVYMGHTYDTPEGCDLFISYFIWDTYRKKIFNIKTNRQ